MDTIVSSPTKKVVIGPKRPFVIIGERINPTGRKLLGKEMAAGNFDRVRKDAVAQVAAGAHMLDVNAGIPMADEPAILAEAITSGGSSLQDHRQVDGTLGYFQHAWRVYGREGRACSACNSAIERAIQSGRSSFFCSKCQKL